VAQKGLLNFLSAEMVEVFITPREEDLEYAMEVRQGGIAADEQSTPDERADVARDDA
jgi:hypothetical protein